MNTARIVSFAAFLFLPTIVFAGTPVNGNVSGTWDVAGSPYWVVDDCQVTGTLTIDPGVEVLFGGNFEINVTGTLNAVGTESNPIVFSSLQPSPAAGDWDRIYLNYCNLTMDWWEVSYGTVGIYMYHADTNWAPIIQNTVITNCSEFGIVAHAHRSNDPSPYYYFQGEIRECTLTACAEGIQLVASGEAYGPARMQANVHDNVITAGTHGFRLEASIEAIIDNNVITECYKGIYSAWNQSAGADIKNNEITDCTYGIYFYRGVNQITICDNIIRNCDNGVYFNLNYDGDVATFNNNSISHCSSFGIFCNRNVDGPFWDNILYSNAVGFYREMDYPSTVRYNCLYNDSLNFEGFPATFGVNWVTNANGDSCDLSFNIMLDPLFVDSLDFHLIGTSPCIDAGDPSGDLDPDYTVGDIGLYYFHQDVPIIVAGEDSLNFGSVEPTLSDTLDLFIYNISGDTLHVSGVELNPSNEFSAWVEGSSSATPDDSVLVKVSFSPTTVGLQQSTLFIYSDAVNEDSLGVGIKGEGGVVPSAVENLEITLDGSDAVLTWSPVTESMSGAPLTPDAYLIFYSDTTAFGFEHYQYLSLTYGDTTFTHDEVVQFAMATYYVVYAYIGDLGRLNELVVDPFRRWTMEELLREL